MRSSPDPDPRLFPAPKHYPGLNNYPNLVGSDGALPSPTAEVHLIRGKSMPKNGLTAARDLTMTPTKVSWRGKGTDGGPNLAHDSHDHALTGPLFKPVEPPGAAAK